MKNKTPNKFKERKSKIKERIKLKLEYSEKIKNEENNKVLKKLNNMKKKELPKIKTLNSNIIDSDSFNFKINKNYKIFNKLKSGILLQKRSNILDKSSPQNTQNMENMKLISYNENINNIYRRVTINDYNNKEMDQNVFYNIINVDNICETNEDIDNRSPSKKSPKYSVNLINSYNNDQLLFNFLNQDKIDYITPKENISSIRMKKKDGSRFNFLRTQTNCNIHNKNDFIKKYNTNKNSFRKIKIDSTKKNINNKKGFNNSVHKNSIYEEDIYSDSKDKNKKRIDNSGGTDSKSMNNYSKSNNINSEEESSDITIISLCSEDIKDLSSDF